MCDMCTSVAAKYTCPGCLKHTCSLGCIKKHKEESGCTGKRDKLKYVPMKEMNDSTLMSDFHVLEEIKRADDIAKRCRPPFPKARLPVHLDNLVRQAQQRRVELVLMNPGMSRRLSNSTRYDTRNRKMMWRLEWLFEGLPDGGTKMVDDRVQEDATLAEVLSSHLELQPGTAAKQFLLRDYADIGVSGLKVFMRKEGTPANQPGFYSIDTTRSLGSQLAGKVVIEFPVLLVALPSEEDRYPAPQQPSFPSEANASHQFGMQPMGHQFGMQPMGRGGPGGRAGSIVLALIIIAVASAHREGDFIQASRRSQFQELRTQWSDLVGHHCPRFGADRLVAIPVPKPEKEFTYTAQETYKIQLSFDDDSFITSWISIIGRHAPPVPVLDVEIRRSGDEITRVTARVEYAPDAYIKNHAQLVNEFKNTTHWPKHLLVRYRFNTQNDVDLDRGLYLLLQLRDVDLDRGLYLLFAVGLMVTIILIINAASGAHLKLAQFLQDVAGDDPAASGGAATWKGEAKAE
eukprot:gene6710-3380_t